MLHNFRGTTHRTVLQERLQQELKGFSSQALCCICYLNCEGVNSGEFRGGSIWSMILLSLIMFVDMEMIKMSPPAIFHEI